MVEWKTIDEISSNIFAGGTPSTKHEEYYDGDIPWIRSGEIDFNVITSAERNITEIGYKNSSAKLIRKGSVVMAMTGATVAKSAIIDFETSANQSVCAIETDESIANYKYLYYCLSKDYFKIKSSAQGALTSLNLANIKQIEIPVPSLSEQQRIVGILDTFTASIDNLKEQIAQRRKQYEYYRDQLLDLEGKPGVEMKTLGEIGKCYTGATPSTKESTYWDNGTIPWMSSGEVHQGIVTHTASFITSEGYNNASTKMLPIGTIVIALAGQGKTRGSVAITAIELCTNQSICGVVIEDINVINKYVYYYLKTQYNNLRKISSGEGTRGGLNLKMIGAYPILLPSLYDQKYIVSILDTFEASIQNLEAQLNQREKQYEYYRNKLLTFE